MQDMNYTIGSLVMNHYRGILRLGTIQSKRKDPEGWMNYRIHFFEDQVYQASEKHRSFLAGEDYFKEVYRCDEIRPVDSVWLNRVLKSYGEYQNER